MGKYIDLSKAQKEEIRRLTQLANRRIKAAFKAYEKEGFQVMPRDVTGGIQVKQQWASEKYALSRSVKFESMQDYKKRLNFLRSFEITRPNMTEYTQIQREKTIMGVSTTLGMEAPDDIKEFLNKATAPQLSRFWKAFSDKAARMGTKYSSDAALAYAMSEIYKEDVTGLASQLTQ